MKMKHKIIWFDHLKPWYLEENEDQESTEKLFDLNILFSKISESSLTETKKQIKDDEYLLHICDFDAKLQMWELQVLRLREKDMPGIYNEEKDTYEIIMLEGEQRIAESTTVLYSIKQHVLFLQRNKFGISRMNLGFYLAKLSGISTTTVLLKPIITGKNIDKINDNSSYKKFILTVGNDHQKEERQTSLGRAISQFRDEYGGEVIKIEIGNGHNHRKLLNGKPITEVIREAYYAPGTEKLQVKAALPDDVEFETIDLLDDRAHSKIELE